MPWHSWPCFLHWRARVFASLLRSSCESCSMDARCRALRHITDVGWSVWAFQHTCFSCLGYRAPRMVVFSWRCGEPAFHRLVPGSGAHGNETSCSCPSRATHSSERSFAGGSHAMNGSLRLRSRPQCRRIYVGMAWQRARPGAPLPTTRASASRHERRWGRWP